MGAGLATTPKDKKSTTPSRETLSPETSPSEQSAFTPSGRGSWNHSTGESNTRGSASGAASGMPAFLQLQVQMKCASCETGEGRKCPECEAEEKQRKDDGLPAVQKKCAACEAEELKANSTTDSARDGVSDANRALPHLDRIQASFGRHDVTGSRAAVGGSAAAATGRMGALAYTAGNRVAFRQEPDLNLAAHEATHVVQQRNGAKLPGGVGRPGDPYEQQADEVAGAVERRESAEPILDRTPSGDSGGSAPAMQPKMDIAASRELEPAVAASRDLDVGGGGAGKDSSAGGGKSAPKTGAKEAGKSDEAGPDGPKGGKKDSPKNTGAAQAGTKGDEIVGAKSGPKQQGVDASTPQSNGNAPGGNDSAPQSGVPQGGNGTAAQPDAAGGSGAAQPVPAGQAVPQGADNASSATPEPVCKGTGEAKCYKPPKNTDDDKPEQEPKDPPPDPEATKAKAEVTGEDPDLPEPDHCPAEKALAANPAANPENAPAVPGATAAGPAAPAAPAGAPHAGAAKGAAGPSAASQAGDPDQGVLPSGAALDSSITSAESQNASATAGYDASSADLEGAADSIASLRAGTRFAPAPDESSEEAGRRNAAAARADRFFSGAADKLDRSVAFASEQLPESLTSEALSVNGRIGEAVKHEKTSISARIAVARSQARQKAASARGIVHAKAEAAIEAARTQAAAAIDVLGASHTSTIEQIGKLETSTLDRLNLIYAKGRVDHEALGTKVGGECVTRGNEFANAYESCKIGKRDSFLDGHLTDRRAEAQQDASHETAEGFRKKLVETAHKRAREFTKAERKTDRCAIIAAASRARTTLDQQFESLSKAIESASDSAVEQAGETRDGLLSSINSSLTATLRQLDRQEHDQRQSADDTGYIQQMLQAQFAHTAAASLQRNVVEVVRGAQSALQSVQSRFAADAPPDPAALDQALSQASQQIDASVGGLQTTLEDGTGDAEAQLSRLGDQGLSSLDAVTTGNDDIATSVSDGFASTMGRLSDTAVTTFGGMQSGITKQMQQSGKDGAAALGKAVGGMQQACDATTSGADAKVAESEKNLEKGLRDNKQGLECEIPAKADEAASKVRPAWKIALAIFLFVLVIVIIIAATIVTAGGAGILAGIVVGAIVGAVTSGMLTVASNLWANQSTFKGFWRSVLIGAVTGAVGGGLGAWAGGAVKGASTVVKIGVAVAVASAVDVGTQFFLGHGSFKNFSWGQLAVTIGITLATFGIGAKFGLKPGALSKYGRIGRFIGGGAAPVAEGGAASGKPTQNETPVPTAQDKAPATTRQDQAPATTPQDQAPATTPQDQAPATTPQDQAPATPAQDQTPTAPQDDTSSTAPRDGTASTVPGEDTLPPVGPREEPLPTGPQNEPTEPTPSEPAPTEAEPTEPAEPAEETGPADEDPAVKKSAKDEAKERLGKVREQQAEKLKEIQELAKERSDAAKKVRNLREKVQASEGPARKQAVEELKQAQEDLRDLEDTNKQLYKEKSDLETKETQLQKSLEGGRLREQYMGDTPGKSSRTGLEVQQRMRAQGTLRDNLVTGEVEFRSAADGNWYPLSDGDMAHVTDAVKWWNETGRAYGPKSPQVREWMLNSKNYTIEHYSPNRSAGAKLPDRYLPPL